MQLIQSQQLTMTSLEISEMVGKRHDNVKRTLETLAESGVIEFPQFEEIKTATKPVVVYRFSGERGRRDSIVLVAQLSPEFTARLVDRWQELEAQMSAPQFNIPTTLSGALRLAAEQAETIEAQQLLIEQQKPSVEFVESYVEAEGLMGFRQVAKLLGANERKFRQMLLDQGVMYYLAGVLTPMAQHIKAGRFEVKTGEADNGHAYTSAKFTTKGVEYVSRLWRAQA